MKNGFLGILAGFGLATGIFLLQGSAHSQTTPPPAAAAQHGQQILEFVANYLDLTDAQRTQAKQIMTDSHAAAAPVAAQLKLGHTSVIAAVKAGDNAGIDRLTAQQGVLLGQLAQIHAHGIAKFYALLTPDQQSKADKLIGMARTMMASRLGAFGVQ